ncbi:hypothetical protein RDI58_019933 [Solanum bulbocastanum]|uniref:NET domain-containing protein n=1 Tax=Solanum bulbocastanum TaxID=147425 RepID=A0AAN8TBU3_SOLBU
MRNWGTSSFLDFEDGWAAIEAKYNPGWRYQMYPDADLPTPATSRNVCRPILFVDEYQVLRHVPEAKVLERDLENLPPEKPGAVGQIIKKRGKIFKQNNEELELDRDSVDVETLW